MPASTESKLNNRRARGAAFAPQTTGIFILLIIVLAFIAGAVRGELVLVLIGAVFLAVWTYCLVMTLLLALIHRGRARRVSIRVSPREIAAGGRARVLYSGGEDAAPRRMFALPGILVRCRLLLHTRDGRRITHDFSPARRGAADLDETIEAAERGAYFSAYDEFAVFDALGFFRFAYRIPLDGAARLLASPHAADEAVPVSARAGESNRQPELSFQRTDNLIDHRPYIPGDDPRRINWKLFGHGGNLFVREGEREPPPHANILVLIDGQFDPLLYSAAAARRGVDLLCEAALATVLSAGAEAGVDALIGCNGETIRGGNAAELAAALAWPAALPWPAASPLTAHRSGAAARTADLPAAPAGRSVVIFALPRANAETSALDRFLRDHAGPGKARPVELLFFCGDDGSGGTVAYSEKLAAAEVCVSLYNQRPGVRARVAET